MTAHTRLRGEHEWFELPPPIGFDFDELASKLASIPLAERVNLPEDFVTVDIDLLCRPLIFGRSIISEYFQVRQLHLYLRKYHQ